MVRISSVIVCAASLLTLQCEIAEGQQDLASDKSVAQVYLQASQSANPEVQFYLGALTSAGVGVPQSNEEAFQWFSRAAEKGHAHAMLILSGLYAIGRGCPKSNISAYKWASIVSSGSGPEDIRNGARQLLGFLEARMSQNEIEQAKTDAARLRSTTGRDASSLSDDGVRAGQKPETNKANSQPQGTEKSGTGRDASSLSDDGIRAGKKLETNNANSLGTEKSGEPERGDKITKSPKRPHTRLPKHPPPKSPSDLNDLVDRVPPEWRKQLGL